MVDGHGFSEGVFSFEAWLIEIEIDGSMVRISREVVRDDVQMGRMKKELANNVS